MVGSEEPDTVQALTAAEQDRIANIEADCAEIKAALAAQRAELTEIKETLRALLEGGGLEALRHIQERRDRKAG